MDGFDGVAKRSVIQIAAVGELPLFKRDAIRVALVAVEEIFFPLIFQMETERRILLSMAFFKVRKRVVECHRFECGRKR